MQLKHGSYEVNPPFVPALLTAAAQHMQCLLAAAEAAGGALSFAVLMPGWREVRVSRGRAGRRAHCCRAGARLHVITRSHVHRCQAGSCWRAAPSCGSTCWWRQQTTVGLPAVHCLARRKAPKTCRGSTAPFDMPCTALPGNQQATAMARHTRGGTCTASRPTTAACSSCRPQQRQPSGR
jgi:hypothetical protein